MKHLFSFVLACAVLSVFTSCGKTYKTPLRGGKLFTQKPVNESLLADQGEGFEQRGDYLVDKGGLQPREGESYEDFSNRLINTLVIQEHDLISYEELISSQEVNLENLSAQLSKLQEQSMDLRTQYKGAIDAMKEDGYRRGSFRPYRVEKGDTLQGVAQKFFGTSTAWLALYQFNQFYIKNPNRIEVGDLIWVPSFIDE